MHFPRVLITTYHHAFLVKGGGEYEIFSIADTLKQQGFIVDIYGPYSRSLDDYDVVLHFSVHGGGLELLEKIKEANIPIVLWPNLWVRDGDIAAPDLINSYLSLADAIIFKSLAEKNNFSKSFKLPIEKCRDITLSVDDSYLIQAPPDLFKTLYGLEKYAIWFGVIEKNKNQLQAVKVLREKGIKIVLVGTARSKSYLQNCLDAGGDDILVIPNLPYKSEIVRSALQGALFYIEVGYEPAGISAIEAGLSGCKLVLSDSEWSREHFGDNAFYADPHSEESLSEAVDRVLMSNVQQKTIDESLKRFCLPHAIEPLVDILQSLTR
ncbi:MULTISPECIES: glycosyltransferase [Rahnella]|uniref:Glycosyltransferase n=1 Tax=Rahnella laticis TaxID=2787622 RepID=A0ABS0E5Y7_9GAMM|nr:MULTISPECIES: glycosyltransferase [Rahnella]MBF7980256.1 glycosyltransferase [Rahnella laticis]MBF8000485.1 glycosyltransferase [Rahnella sp. LAC-M12]